MSLTKEQLQLLIDCAPEPTVLYLCEDEKSDLVPFLYTADVPAFSGLTEAEYQELYCDNAFQAVLPQDLPVLENIVRRIFREKVPGTCTYRTFHKTKGTVWTHAALKWIGEFEGKSVLLGIFTDVSGQVAENTPGGFFVYAAQEDDQFFFVGENMLEMLGYTRSEFTEKYHNRFRYMVYEEDREATLQSIERQIAENGHYDKVDYRIEKKDGSLLWVHDEGHYIVDSESRPWYYVTINDMSDVVEKNSRLQKENKELSGIIHSIPVGLAVYMMKNSRASLVALNDTACEILCVTQKQVEEGTQHIFSERIHPEDIGRQNVHMKDIQNPGRHESVPFRYAGLDGRWRWLRLATETIKGADGTLFLYNVITDLTAERQAEEKLEHEHHIQQEQFQSSLKALILANPNSLCTVRLNLSGNRCEEWFGTSAFVIRTIQAETAEGVIDNISRIIINENDRLQFREHFNRAALIKAFHSGRRQDTLRYRRTVEDGSSIWVETVINMVENPETHEIEAVLFSENVNRQVLNEKIIQISTDTGSEYIATLQLPQQVFQFRFMGDYISSRYRELYESINRHRPFAEVVDYAVRTWVAPEETEHFRKEAEIASIVDHLNRTGSYTITIKSRQTGGQDGWKQIRLAWLFETKDWILIQQADISDAVHRQQAELLERLNTEKALRYEADKANESKSNFIANVSHDMRTPLNAILGYDRLALESGNNAEQTDYLQKIGEAGETLLSLINDTLDLQKIENGVTTLHPEPVACSTVVNGIITAVKPMMDAKDIHFVFDNSKACWATINVDAMRLEEIFINLLSNAAKFTPRGGEVLFAVECVKETETEIHDKLTVRDNGIGISSEFLSKIYEPFTQERTEKTAGIGGSGLGLSIVRRLVDLMHGRIEVTSRLGEGTEFMVYLTFEKASAETAPHPEKTAGEWSFLQGKTILLCEDNAMNREIATALLEKHGMAVTAAANGREGARTFTESAAGAIAAVLMDIRMPVMDGYEAARAIRTSSHPDAGRVPIIALSADVYAGDVEKARECGMNGHLSKPLDPELLLEMLQQEIGRAESGR